MKKQIFTLAMAVTAAIAQAQIAPQAPPPTPGGPAQTSSPDEGNTYKQESGDKTFELNFTPLGNTPISLSYLRFRYFLSDDLALRTGLNLALRTTSHNDDQSDADITDKTNQKTSVFDFAILPGIEKHFAGTGRLSPYVGAELGIGIRSASASQETSFGPNGSVENTNVSISGATSNFGSSAGFNDRGFFALSLNGVIGCDFYFSRKIYMGLEGGYGMIMRSYTQVSTTRTTGNVSTTVKDSKDGEFRLSPVFNGAIRIGFAF